MRARECIQCHIDMQNKFYKRYPQYLPEKTVLIQHIPGGKLHFHKSTKDGVKLYAMCGRALNAPRLRDKSREMRFILTTTWMRG